jgi:hypothetical protein
VLGAIEYAVLRRRRLAHGSLEAFLSAYVRARNVGDPAGRRVPFDDFREKYETFCAYAHLPTERADSRRALKTLRGVAHCRLASRASPASDAFIGVRWKSAREVECLKAAGEPFGVKPFEGSLDAFLRVRCAITGLAADVIPQGLFFTKYHNFCAALGIEAPALVTKGILAEGYGIGFQRLEVRELVPTDTKKVLDLGIDLADALADRAANLAQRGHHDDLWTGLAHFVFGALLPVPLALCAFIAEDYASLTATNEWCELRAALVGLAWRGEDCVRAMSWWNYGLMHIALFLWVFGLLAAHAHYLTPFDDPFAVTRETDAVAKDAEGDERGSPADADEAARGAAADGGGEQSEGDDLAAAGAPLAPLLDDGAIAAAGALLDDGAIAAAGVGSRLAMAFGRLFIGLYVGSRLKPLPALIRLLSLPTPTSLCLVSELPSALNLCMIRRCPPPPPPSPGTTGLSLQQPLASAATSCSSSCGASLARSSTRQSSCRMRRRRSSSPSTSPHRAPRSGCSTARPSASPATRCNASYVRTRRARPRSCARTMASPPQPRRSATR